MTDEEWFEAREDLKREIERLLTSEDTLQNSLMAEQAETYRLRAEVERLTRERDQERALKETAQVHLNERLIAAGNANLIARADAAERERDEAIASNRFVVEETQKLADAMAEKMNSLMDQVAERDELLFRAETAERERDEWMERAGKWMSRSESAERQVAALREALDYVLGDIDFMVERGVITDIRNDVIYVRARAAIAETEKKDTNGHPDLPGRRSDAGSSDDAASES